LGSSYNHRGFSKPSAYLVTVNPSGAIGVFPFSHPITLEKLETDFVAKGGGIESIFDV
jgi:hypothetical protein